MGTVVLAGAGVGAGPGDGTRVMLTHAALATHAAMAVPAVRVRRTLKRSESVIAFVRLGEARVKRGATEGCVLPACKPGSVRRFSRSIVTVISLGAQSPTRSSSLPAASLSEWTPLAAYLALLPLGFTLPPVLPRAR